MRDLTKIVIAAADGRIERLFIASDKERWGVFDAGERHVVTRADRQPADSDLLDVAAAMAYLGGAEIWTIPAVDLPAGSDSIALLQY